MTTLRFSGRGSPAAMPVLSTGYRRLASCPAQRAGAQRLCAVTHCRRASLLPERPAYPALGSRHRRGNTSPRLVRGLRPRDRQKIPVPLGNFRNLHSQSPTIEPTLGSAKSGRYRGISARACSGWCAEKRIPGSGTATFIPAFGAANLAKSAASNAKRNGASDFHSFSDPADGRTATKGPCASCASITSCSRAAVGVRT